MNMLGPPAVDPVGVTTTAGGGVPVPVGVGDGGGDTVPLLAPETICEACAGEMVSVAVAVVEFEFGVTVELEPELEPPWPVMMSWLID